MVAKRFDNVKIEIQAKTGRTWDQIQDMRSSVKSVLMISKNFFQARKSEKLCLCSFLGLVETSRMVYVILENFKIWSVLPAIVRKKEVVRRFCYNYPKTLIKGSC